MSIIDNGAPATPTPFAAAQDPNPVKSVPPFANPLTEWRGFAAQAWAAWFNQVAQKVAEQLAQVAYSGSYNDLLQAPGTVYENPSAGLIPAMTGDNQTIATASVNPELAWMAFNYNASNQWQNTSKLASGTAVTLTYKFAAAQTPKSVSINLNRPTNGFTLEGSNDNGSTWTQLFSTSATLPASATEYSFTFTNATGYKWFRFTVYATSNGWLAVQWLQLYGSSAQVDYGGKDFVNVGNIAAASEKLAGPLGIGGASPTAAYPVDVRGGVTSQVHIAPTDVDDGSWITSYASGGHPASYLSAGAIFNGTNWIAKNSQAAILGLDPTGKFVVFFNSGLTVGATFTPTPAAIGSAQTPWTSNINAAGYQLQNAGNIGIGTASPAYSVDATGSIRAGQYWMLPADSGYEWWAGAYSVAGTWQIVRRQIVGPNAWTAPFTVTPAGNIGIGTASPSNPLQMGGGAYCTGTTWTNSSDRDLKRDFAEVDLPAVLAKLDSLRIQEWSYINDEPDVRRIGPTGQDFYAAFGYGDSETSISTVDGIGVALAAIKALSDRVRKLEAALARHLTLQK